MTPETRWYAVLLVVFVFGSLLITRAAFTAPEAPHAIANATTTPGAYQRASFVNEASAQPSTPEPTRNWSVLDPTVSATAALMQSLDTSFPFLNYHTYTPWPMASLTKLITAVTFLERFGPDVKVPITETAVSTDGEAGGLTTGEVYRARDLMKIMLMTSSNDAATAFAEYGGATSTFIGLMRDTLRTIGMTETSVVDSSGLDVADTSTASDLVRLARYIAAHEPDILGWTRLKTLTVQAENATAARTIENIDPLVARSDFIGGKTGTTPQAHENLMAIFTFHGYRVIIVILGSANRLALTDQLLTWLGSAYDLAPVTN